MTHGDDDYLPENSTTLYVLAAWYLEERDGLAVCSFSNDAFP